jgi:ABC-2 type transport system permease protein
MSLPHAIVAELRKTTTQPATAVALAVAVLGPVAIALLHAAGGRTDPVEAAFSAVPLGTIGAVVLGVVAISGEYATNSTDTGGGRQITATLTATPQRSTLLTAKVITVVLLVSVVAVTAIPAALAVAHAVTGSTTAGAATPADVASRALGAGLYWALTALIALAITTLTRSGIVPLIVLIANSSLVSLSFLLSKVTPLARYLPDLAGIRLFARESSIAVEDALDPLTGGLVMTGWSAGLLVIAAVAFVRRDA